MIWQDFKELNFISFNKDAIFYLSSWTLERALILYPLEKMLKLYKFMLGCGEFV